MYKQLFEHEIKNFLRSPNFGANLIFKILAGFGFLSMGFSMAILTVFGILYAQKELNINPIEISSKYFIYLWALDLVGRFMVQQMPTNNIKPYLTLNITKKQLVKFSIIKTFLSFFNWTYILIFLPFFVLMLIFGYPPFQSLSWIIALWAILILNNFLNIIFHGNKTLMFLILGSVALLGYLEYYRIFEISAYSEPIFSAFYHFPGLTIVPLLVLSAAIWYAYRLIYNTFYLDAGLKEKEAVAMNENIDFLDKFGVLGSFLKNDIRLILRNKYPRQVLLTGVLFLFYGLLIYASESYQSIWFKFLAGLLITGGFALTFGAKVPSWDSSYYSLMLTQNVPYKTYLEAKWWLMVVATAISMVLASFYLFINVEYYLIILVAGIYNLGVNSHLTLLGGAFIKSPVDLNAKAKTFGDKNAFNLKNMLLSVPKMLFPMAVFTILYYSVNTTFALVAVATLGILGVLLRNFVFNQIILIYKNEKYQTLNSFKNIP